jgi:hypothetical protein
VEQQFGEPPGQLAVRFDRGRKLSLQVGSRGLQRCVVEAVGVQPVERRQREIACEEIAAELDKAGLGGTSADAKTRRPRLLEECFGTASKTALESMKSESLREGLAKLRIRLSEMAEVQK